jgi:heat shock protein HslJ
MGVDPHSGNTVIMGIDLYAFAKFSKMVDTYCMNQTTSKKAPRSASLAMVSALWLSLVACAGTSKAPEESSYLWGTEWRLTSIGEQSAPMESEATLLLTRAQSVAGRWRLIALNDEATKDRKKMTLEHLQFGRIGGNGSCNGFSANATIDVYHLQVGAISSTKKSCSSEVMHQESSYLQALQKARTFELEEEQLLIRTSDQGLSLRFVRIK